MTPSEELRAFARLLRDAAAKGTPEADAAWIALASPALAEPLAVLIDDLADFAGEVTTEPPAGHIVGKALAVARGRTGAA